MPKALLPDYQVHAVGVLGQFFVYQAGSSSSN
jgi:hypothetical protein